MYDMTDELKLDLFKRTINILIQHKINELPGLNFFLELANTNGGAHAYLLARSWSKAACNS